MARRVQVDDPTAKPSIRPSARPVDTFVRPARDDVSELTNALAGFSRTLGAISEQRDRARLEEAEAAAERKLGGMTIEEVQEARKAGTLAPPDDPWLQAAMSRGYGLKLAQHRRDDLIQRLSGINTSGDPNASNAFDLENGNIEQFIAQVQRDDLAGLTNRHEVSAYTQVMERYAPSFRTGAIKAQVEVAKDKGKQTFFEQGLETLRNASDPLSGIQAVRASYEGAEKLYGLTKPELDAEMLRMAATLAEQPGGNYELVNAIINDDRGGIGPLGHKRELAAGAVKILETSRKAMVEAKRSGSLDALVSFSDKARQGIIDENELREWHKANPGVVSEAQIVSWITQSRANFRSNQEQLAKENQKKALTDALNAQDMAVDRFLLDQGEKGSLLGLTPIPVKSVKNGELVDDTVSPDDARKRAVELYTYEQSPRIAKANNETPSQTFNRELNWFATNGLTNPVWESYLNGGYQAASSVAITAENPPESLTAALNLYTEMHAKNSNALAKHLKDGNAETFYEAYRIAKQYGQMTDQQALATALQYKRDPEAAGLRLQWEDVNTEVKKALSSEVWLGIFGSKAGNRSYVEAQIRDLGRLYTTFGLPTDKAVEEARKRFLDTHTQINGWFVRTKDKAIPQNFGQMAEGYIADYAAKNGLEDDDLTAIPLDPNAQGAWVIFRKSPPSPVNATDAVFTLNNLMEWEVERQQKVRDGIIENNANRNVRQMDDVTRQQLEGWRQTVPQGSTPTKPTAPMQQSIEGWRQTVPKNRKPQQ